MNTLKIIGTPSDTPAKPVKSPSAVAGTLGFLGGPNVFVNRLELSSPTDGPIGDHNIDHKSTPKLTPNDLILIDTSGYILSERDALRLKGDGDTYDTDSNYNTPFAPVEQYRTKRKKHADSRNTSPLSEQSHCLTCAAKIEKLSDEVEETVTDTRQILEDMLKEAKMGRKWCTALNH